MLTGVMLTVVGVLSVVVNKTGNVMVGVDPSHAFG
jgi:hypothetical protein